MTLQGKQRHRTEIYSILKGIIYVKLYEEHAAGQTPCSVDLIFFFQNMTHFLKSNPYINQTLTQKRPVKNKKL